MPDMVTAVVVSFSDPDATQSAIESLLAQTHPPIEVLVVDNHPQRRTASALEREPLDARVRVVHSGANIGYARGCNVAAAAAQGDWLFFLNPDAQAEPDCISALLAAADPQTGLVGAQVILRDGRTNAGDNPLHVTGLAWAGRFGEPPETGPSRSVAAVSGAALFARAEAYRTLAGLCEAFFMYYEDTDLCWRMRLAGWEVVFCPRGIVCHEYEFDKGTAKWGRLERNRLWAVLCNYSTPALLLLAPLIACTELAIAVRATVAGWCPALLRAWISIARRRPARRAWRHRVQSSRRVSDDQVIELMTGTFDTPLVRLGPLAPLNRFVELYRRTVLAILRTGHL